MASLDKELAGLLGDEEWLEEENHFMSSSLLPLDIVLSGNPDGGFATGRIYEIYGPESSGKTAMATMAMIAAQKAGGVGIFVDYERSFKKDFAEDLGLNTKRPHFMYIKPVTWEEGNTKALEVAEAIRNSKEFADKPIVIVQDSVAAAVPKSVAEKGISEYNMNDTTALARVTSSTLKAVNLFVDDMDVVMIYLNQIREKPGVMFGNPETTPGGKALKFYASVRISLGKKVKSEEGRVHEHEITAKIIKNKVTQSVGEKVKWNIAYERSGAGQKSIGRIDTTGALVDYMKENGFLERAGNRIKFIDGKTYPRATLIKHIDDNDLTGDVIKHLKENI